MSIFRISLIVSILLSCIYPAKAQTVHKWGNLKMTVPAGWEFKVITKGEGYRFACCNKEGDCLMYSQVKGDRTDFTNAFGNDIVHIKTKVGQFDAVSYSRAEMDGPDPHVFTQYGFNACGNIITLNTMILSSRKETSKDAIDLMMNSLKCTK